MIELACAAEDFYGYAFRSGSLRWAVVLVGRTANEQSTCPSIHRHLPARYFDRKTDSRVLTRTRYEVGLF
jgi:hypothetical protein